MHGRPRQKLDTSLDEATKLDLEKKRTKKAALFGGLCAKVLDACERRDYDESLLKMSEELLEKNPEMYTVWNYRRGYVEPLLARGRRGSPGRKARTVRH